eukprot:365445-Chlamydomonas_euryale.AAC.4
MCLQQNEELRLEHSNRRTWSAQHGAVVADPANPVSERESHLDVRNSIAGSRPKYVTVCGSPVPNM